MQIEKPILIDPDQYPTEDVVFSCIGKKKALWIDFFDTLHDMTGQAATQPLRQGHFEFDRVKLLR